MGPGGRSPASPNGPSRVRTTRARRSGGSGPVAQPPATPPTTDNSGDLAYVPLAGPGVRAILAADPSFDVARFLEGAKAAYRLILESFWKGDVDTLKPHVDAHVYETFADAVEQRKNGRPHAR